MIEGKWQRIVNRNDNMNTNTTNKTRHDKRSISGMTLLELIVYIALAGLLLAPVVMLMNKSSVNMARDTKSLELRVSGRDILDIMYSDIKNTGFKIRSLTAAGVHIDSLAVYRCNQNNNNTPSVCAGNPHDTSSFRHTRNIGAYDTLEIIRGVRTAAGAWDYAEKVRYRVNTADSTLVREIISQTRRNVAASNAPVAVNPLIGNQTTILAHNVEALKFEYSQDMNTWRNDLTGTTEPNLSNKARMKYIRVTIALKDNKRLSPAAKTTPDTLVRASVGTPQTSFISTLPASQRTLREIHQIVIPVPNNGLFP